MVQKLKDHLDSPEWLRRYNSILLTISSLIGGVVIYFLVKIDNKVDVSYDFATTQRETNVRFHEKFNTLYEMQTELNDKADKMDARIAEISVRLWNHQIEEYQKIGRIESLITRQQEN